MLQEPQVLVVDFGCQYGPLIGRRSRKLGRRVAFLKPKNVPKWLENNRPKGIILSGSGDSTSDKNASKIPPEVFKLGVPILGICYGMQALAHELGGKVERTQPEYGPAKIMLTNDPLFKGISTMQDVWASHSDTVTELPQGAQVIATSEHLTGIRGMCIPDRKIWGVQFHPEVMETPCGMALLLNFIEDIAGCERDWEPQSVIAEHREKIRKAVGPNEIVIAGGSGGVDSSVAIALAKPVLGDRLHVFCVDGGQFRMHELDVVGEHIKVLGADLEMIDIKREVLLAMGSVLDLGPQTLFRKLDQLLLDLWEVVLDQFTESSERKRRRFIREYQKAFISVAKRYKAKYELQGTNYADKQESGVGGTKKQKTHHNVEKMKGLGKIEPLAELFKDEIRELASELGLPDSIVNREPSPGPGLLIRIFGGRVTQARLDLIRWATYEIDLIREKWKGKLPPISQLVPGLCCAKTTGTIGSDRSYAYAVVIHALHTTDFMTGKGVKFPEAFREEVTMRLTQHRDIVRVWWDEGHKPRSTTEFE